MFDLVHLVDCCNCNRQAHDDFRLLPNDIPTVDFHITVYWPIAGFDVSCELPSCAIVRGPGPTA